ncbi:MAG: UbiH/UbiF family hydroxylase [Hyphomicrobiales bacterium]|nr:UbiH/UbiF family hydroxylase [Hyphomicrobiales bacterium]MBV9426357.1 UbiH/UbiF family hydroxylase [Bradyrhizobiaceae bacterium]
MAQETRSLTAEAVVVGGGPAGLTAAIALAAGGIETMLVARRPEGPDNRTSALLAGSVTALDVLGVWEACRDHAAPLRTIRLVDDTRRLLRAPEVSFAAGEIGFDAFGHNIENRHLVAALEARAAQLARLTRIDAPATAVTPGTEAITLELEDGRTITAQLAVGADGRKSLCRAAANIVTDGFRYPQAALTLNFAHARPHRDVSTEFHTETGPFTLVPLPGKCSSLVCVVEPAEAERLAALPADTLSEIVERRAHSILGKVAVEPGRGVFPLAIETARRFAAERVVLVGEAAHVVPPIGAQGLNLGLRDAATIGELAVAARHAGADLGSAALLAHYDRLRRPDIASRTAAVDVLNRSLLADFLPAHGVRGFGLYLLDQIGPLRRAVMREGVAPSAFEPRLMRGEAL